MTTTIKPGDLIRRTDPELNPRPYRVLRVHGEWVFAKPVDGGAAIDIPVKLVSIVEGEG